MREVAEACRAHGVPVILYAHHTTDLSDKLPSNLLALIVDFSAFPITSPAEREVMESYAAHALEKGAGTVIILTSQGELLYRCKEKSLAFPPQENIKPYLVKNLFTGALAYYYTTGIGLEAAVGKAHRALRKIRQ